MTVCSVYQYALHSLGRQYNLLHEHLHTAVLKTTLILDTLPSNHAGVPAFLLGCCGALVLLNLMPAQQFSNIVTV